MNVFCFLVSCHRPEFGVACDPLPVTAFAHSLKPLPIPRTETLSEIVIQLSRCGVFNSAGETVMSSDLTGGPSTLLPALRSVYTRDVYCLHCLR